MSFNLRDALNAIFTKTDYIVPKDYNQFAVNLFLSKYKGFIEIVDMLLIKQIPNKAHFKFLQKNLPYGWPRKTELPQKKEDKKIEYVIRFYECSRRDALDYLKYMKEDELKNIIEYYEE